MMWDINPCVKAESRQEGRATSGRPLLNKRHERIRPKDDGGWNKLFPILIHRPLFLLLLNLPTLSSPPLPACLLSTSLGVTECITVVFSFKKKMGRCRVHKMNALAHQCGANRAGVRMGCGGERKGVKYCNYHPIDFQWRDRENKCYSVNVHSTWRGGGPPPRKEESRERKKKELLPFPVCTSIFLQTFVLLLSAFTVLSKIIQQLLSTTLDFI